jgi:hypothetical protein
MDYYAQAQKEMFRCCKVITARQMLLFIFALFISLNSYSIEKIQLSIGKISLAQWLSSEWSASEISDSKQSDFIQQLQLDQLMVTVDLTSTPLKLKIDSSKLKLPAPYQNINALIIVCQDLMMTEASISCQQGKISFQGLIAQADVSADFSFNFDKENNEIQFSLDNLHLANSNIFFSLKLVNNHWTSIFKADGLDYQFFQTFIKDYLAQQNSSDFYEQLKDAGAIINFSGQASGILNDDTVSGSLLNQLDIKGKITQLHYQYGDDMADNLALSFSSKISKRKSKVKTIPPDYDVSLSINALSGELLQNDTYILFSGKESLRSRFTLYNNQRIDISQFSLSSKDIIELNGKAKLNYKNSIKFKQLDSALIIKNLSRFNQAYLSNILSGTDYEEIKIEGTVTGHLSINKNNIKADTIFNDFSIEFNENLVLVGLNGEIKWNNAAFNDKEIKLATSHLSWQELLLNDLPLGRSEFNFILHNDYLKLLNGTDIPIFDGALHINSLEIDHIHPLLAHQDGQKRKIKTKSEHKGGMTLTVDGMIKPVSLALLSEHFNWPLLDGSLSAVIPSTTYNEQFLTVGGALMLKVFDGIIIIKDLRIDEPLQDYAQLFANIDLINLSLKSLTKTYNFGQIEGRLEGQLKELELNAWVPVAFDATLKTPDNDDSRHRISQTAIDNISSLGGASGLLSRTFLGFFETFRYDKIGLSCKLKNNVCQMSGVEPKGNGYYIVKGGGIPRIDVMGFQRQVSWSTLTSRLKAIQSANEAVIE